MPNRDEIIQTLAQLDPAALEGVITSAYRQRQGAQGCLDDAPQGLRRRRQVLLRGLAADQERGHVRRHGQRRRLRAEREDRPDPVGVLVGHRSEDLHGVLRLGEPGARHGRGSALLRPARRQHGGPGHEDRRGEVEDAPREVGERLHRHERASLLRRNHLQRHLRRRVRRAGPADRARRQVRRNPVALVHAPGARRARQRDLAARHRSFDARRRHHLEHTGARSRPRARLLRHRQLRSGLRRLDARGRQPLLRLDDGPEGEDRGVRLALPASAPRHLGLRRGQPGGPLRHRDRRQAAQGHRRGRAHGLGVHPRSDGRQAPDRNRREAGTSGPAAEDGQDPADPPRRRDRAAVCRAADGL